jgi:antitoxin (DNA-binding transcriptional repressor) of toxin-antitoxin stability system
MYHMEKASIRDLRYNFKKIERLLEKGEEIEITKRRRPIARLAPMERPRRKKLPDFEAQLRAIYGDRVLPTTGAEIIAWDRDRY